MNNKLIYWNGELNKEYNDIVGKKCANIGELVKIGFRVPPGYSIAVDAYEEFMENSNAIEDIRQHLVTFTADPNLPADMPKYAELSKELRRIVELKTISQATADTIASYYKELCMKAGVCDVPVSVRSSGPVSHPGQFETYLHVIGTQNLAANVIKVWSSTFNQRSLIKRAREGSLLESDPIGVCVLQMVNARSAGVMFTINPMNGDPSKIMIEGNWGLGEGVVSGEVTPDEWVIDKAISEIIEAKISQKLKQYIVNPKTDRASFADMPTPKQNAPCLTEQEILELAKMGRRIEEHFGVAQDIEWAVDASLPFPDNIFILQARQEQIWSKKKAAPKLRTTGSLLGDIAGMLKDMKA